MCAIKSSLIVPTNECILHFEMQYICVFAHVCVGWEACGNDALS